MMINIYKSLLWYLLFMFKYNQLKNIIIIDSFPSLLNRKHICFLSLNDWNNVIKTSLIIAIIIIIIIVIIIIILIEQFYFIGFFFIKKINMFLNNYAWINSKQIKKISIIIIYVCFYIYLFNDKV